jgi:hypothetical protein
MALLSSFINIADRIGLPVKMLKYVQARFDIGTTSGGGHTYHGAANKLRLNEDKMAALTAATIGGIDANGELEFDDEHEAVTELYHEATHAYIKLKVAETDEMPDPVSASESQQAGLRVKVVMADAAMHYVKNAPEAYFTNLLDRNQLNSVAFGGVPISHRAPAIQERVRKGQPIGSSPLEQQILARARQMASEAAAMYVAHRASKYWYTYDWLVFERNWLKKMISSGDYIRKPLSAYGTDKINAEVQALFGQQQGYTDAMKNLVHGYYQIGFNFYFLRRTRQFKLQQPEIPANLKKLCDGMLEHKIPDHFFASPSFAKLSAEIIRLIERMRAEREATP